MSVAKRMIAGHRRYGCAAGRRRWKLAFQGNIRAWPDADHSTVRAALAGAAA